MEPEISGVSIVVLGTFNPAIPSPAWLFYNDLVAKADYTVITAEGTAMVTPDATEISGEWFTLQILRDRLQINRIAPDASEAVRDLARGILALLPHTPVDAFGINHEAHYRADSVDAWDAVGAKLAPRDNFRDAFPQENRQGPMGMRSLTYEQSFLDNSPWRMQVKVQPSMRIENGIYLHTNCHYLPSADAGEDGAWFGMAVEDRWAEAEQVSSVAMSQLLEVTAT